jgi:hypothetical protein
MALSDVPAEDSTGTWRLCPDCGDLIDGSSHADCDPLALVIIGADLSALQLSVLTSLPTQGGQDAEDPHAVRA